MTPLELLAPARSADIGIAAIRCGADAVYIGGPSFGARVAAGNSVEDIKRLCREAAPFGVRIYVTVNTLAVDDEQRRNMLEMMLSLKDSGIQAFIIQDTTLLPMIREHGPWLEELHASTQCAIRTPERARELVAMGFTRLILERELSLAQIRAIHEAVPETELEFFVHGALCVCYSGDCYLSEMLTGRSANRGECAQPCRSNYDLLDRSGKVLLRGKPLLSLKDLNLIKRLPDLAAEGIISFKIEGRLKNESYVKNIVRAYSNALDSLVSANPDLYCRSSIGRVSGGFRPDPDKTFNRSYTQLYLDGVKGDWNSADAAKGMGEFLGTLGHHKAIHNGDGLCYVNEKGEVVGFRADRVEDGRIVSRNLDRKLPHDTRIWRNRDNEFEHSLEVDMPQRLIDVEVDLTIDSGGVDVRAFSRDGRTITQHADTSDCPVANNAGRMLMMIRTAFGKNSGNYSFTCRNIESADSIPLLSSAFLNNLRRSISESFDSNPPLPLRKSATPCDSVHIHPHRKDELMRTRYCVLHQMGWCPRQNPGKAPAYARESLVLRNAGRSIALSFDCRNCEMVLKDARDSK